MELEDKIVLEGCRKVYCEYDPATGVLYCVYDFLNTSLLKCSSGLIISKVGLRTGGP